MIFSVQTRCEFLKAVKSFGYFLMSRVDDCNDIKYKQVRKRPLGRQRNRR